jgi:hypothetical protein
MPTHPNIKNLDEILQRSDALDEAVIGLLEPVTYQTCDSSKRISASFAACSVSLEHARGLRALILGGLPTSAIGLMRLQFEALTRSVWLYYAASDVDVENLRMSLTPAAEKAANKLPMLSEMLRAIDGKAPPAATQMLTQFKDVTMGALHSFVHGGIHPLHRQSEGYPMSLLIQVVQNSNALFTMSGMMFANLYDNADISKRMSGIQSAFMDCLPELLPAAAS